MTPIPGEGKSSFAYPDTGRKLVDGAIFKKFVGGSTGAKFIHTCIQVGPKRTEEIFP